MIENIPGNYLFWMSGIYPEFYKNESICSFKLDGFLDGTTEPTIDVPTFKLSFIARKLKGVWLPQNLDYHL